MLDNISILLLLITIFALVLILSHSDDKERTMPPFVVASMGFFKENGIYIFTLVSLILTIIAFAKSIGWNFNPNVEHQLKSVVTIEGMENKASKGFCKSLLHNSHEREINCNKLSKENCQVSDCCIYLNGKKCVAGNAHGPVYRTDKDGNNIDIDQYYFKSKCHGKC